MTKASHKSWLFLLVLLRQITLAVLVIHNPQLCNKSIFDLTILEPLPIYLVSLALTDEIRQKYRPDMKRRVTCRFALISLFLTGLYAIYPIYVIIHQLYYPASPLAFTLCLSAGETLFGLHLRRIFKSMFRGPMKK